jgi:Putative zinc-finger/HEAT repeats
MNCEQITELLPDYLRGSLGAAQVREVETHLGQCAECRDDVAVWKKLSLLPVEEPSAAVGHRIDALVEAYQAGRADGANAAGAEGKRAARHSAFDWLRSPMAGLAWGMALLLVGVFGGILASNYASRSNSRSDEMAVMRSQLSDMRQLVVLSMLQQQSASERLQGVSFSRADVQSDPKVQAALLRTLRYDASVDVRLAALEALSHRSTQPQVHREVSDALQDQKSPLVQVALIDQLVEWRDPGVAQRLREFEQSPDLNPTVRQRAQWAVNKLTN